MLSPAVFLTYPVPKIVMLPIFMIWFGIGDLSKVLIIALACFYPVFINAYYGVRQTRTILVWSALNMGASQASIFRRVVLPMREVVTGARVVPPDRPLVFKSVGMSWQDLVVASAVVEKHDGGGLGG